MASVPRDYVADEPVLVTTRCVLRVRFMERPAMKTEIKRQIAKWATRCGVEVIAFTIAPPPCKEPQEGDIRGR